MHIDKGRINCIHKLGQNNKTLTLIFLKQRCSLRMPFREANRVRLSAPRPVK